uniref:Uncharacterized protein n=1 Tax=Romanomermis culicivorax TaxID=13658 RepID=A0A915KZG1_ROMCU
MILLLVPEILYGIVPIILAIGYLMTSRPSSEVFSLSNPIISFVHSSSTIALPSFLEMFQKIRDKNLPSLLSTVFFFSKIKTANTVAFTLIVVYSFITRSSNNLLFFFVDLEGSIMTSGSNFAEYHHESPFTNNNNNTFDSQTLSSIDCDSVSVIGTPNMNPKGKYQNRMSTFRGRVGLNSRTMAVPLDNSPDITATVVANELPFKAAHKLRLTSTSTFASSFDGRRQSISDDDSGCVFDDYSCRPPTVPPDLVYEYFKCLPPEKVPYFKSVGEEWRKNQLDYQQPMCDSNPRYCNSQSEIQTKRCFDVWRSDASGRGTVQIANFDQCNFVLQCCRMCEAQIFPNEIVVSLNNFGDNGELHLWHPACFNCTTCKELLVDLNYCLFDGKIYCGRHHAEMFKPRCPACDEIIFASEGIEAGGVTYHVDHFVCTCCRNPVGENKYVMKDNTHPVCLTCYQKDHCAACQAPFRAGDAKVTRGQHFWHANNRCFACSNCRSSLLGKDFLKNEQNDASQDDGKLFCGIGCKAQFEGLDSKMPNLMQTRLSLSKPATKSREKRPPPTTRYQKSKMNQSNNNNIDKKSQQQQSHKKLNDNLIVELKKQQQRQVINYTGEKINDEHRDDNDSSSSESNYASISPRIQRPVKKLTPIKDIEKVHRVIKNTASQVELDNDEYDSEASTSKSTSPIIENFCQASTSLSSTFQDQDENGNVQPYVTTILPSPSTSSSSPKNSPSKAMTLPKNNNQACQRQQTVRKPTNSKSVHFCPKTLKAEDLQNHDRDRFSRFLHEDSDSDDSSSIDDNYSKKNQRSNERKMSDEVDWSSTTSSDEDDDYADGNPLTSDMSNLAISERCAKNFRRNAVGEAAHEDKTEGKKRRYKNRNSKSNSTCLIS